MWRQGRKQSIHRTRPNGMSPGHTCLHAPTTTRRRNIPHISNRKLLVAVGNGTNRVTRGELVRKTKTVKTDHFYLNGQSDRPPSSQPEEDLLKQPTRNSTQSKKPGKRPKWSGFLLPEKEHSRGMTKTPNQNAPRLRT